MMSTPTFRPASTRQCWRQTIGMLMLPMLGLALTGCGSLWPAASPQPAFFTLQAVPGPAEVARNMSRSAPAPALAGASPVLLVHVPSAAPGFDSARIMYTSQPHRLEYFARHEWVDAPARMLAPLMVAALERGTGFSAVVLAPSVATGGVQLHTQLLRLQQEFAAPPSQVRLALRAQLVDTRSRQVLATRDFEHVAVSASEDAPGGVAAAQVAAQAVLAELAAWCQAVVAAPRVPAAP